ncbi:nucleoid-associated protein [Moraxella catarrhalis]|uniref:nucleoid-associated protein n=1 Tax=Moraxella catarrhalis TaxID=480 RepID=UPI0013D6B8BC|nr:nucleoid-associated protein [Moraxella catarrhalis]
MITIQNIIYHIFEKVQHEKGVIALNPSALTPDDNHIEFLTLLTEKYAKQAGKGFGHFGADTDVYKMPTLLTDYLSDEDFYHLSKRMMSILKDEADKEPFATGGKVFICQYTENSTNFVLITVLTEHTTFSAQDWQFEKTESLDLERLKYAGRINIDKWQADEERYISFLKGKQAEISGYFKHFLGCDDAVIAKTETAKLLVLIDKFIESQEMSFDEGQSFKEKVQTYLKGLIDNKTEFNTQSFANHLHSEEPQLLIDVLSDLDTGISDGFIPDSRMIKKLSTYAAKTKDWQFSFNNQAITNGEITHDNGKIIINNPTDELLKAFSPE